MVFQNVPITQIMVPASLESADAPFSGSGLTDVYFGNGTTKVINSLFTNCSKLKNVNLPDEVTSIGRSAFSGCSSLTTLTLPISVTTIGDYAFENCTGLKELYVRHKIKEIGNRSFNNCPSLYVRGSLYSNTMMTMIDHDVNMNFTDTVYKDESNKILDHFNSVYELNTTSASGYTTLNLEYSLKTKAVNKATDLKIIVKLPSTSIVKDIKLDGKSLKDSYSTNQNLITIPVSAKSGKCQIFTTPNENGRMVSYAALSYKSEGKAGTDIIGAISDDCSCLTLQMPDSVGYEEDKNSASLEIRGFGQKEKDVEVYLDGKLVGETVVSKGGMYSSKLTLPEPEDYKTYKVRVKSVDKNGNDVEIIRSVKTVNGEPELESAELYIEAHDYKNGYQEFNLLESDSLIRYITFQPGKAYRFTIKYINKDKISHVYVVSKRGGVSKKLEAVYDAGKDAYVTKGFFDNDSNYVPGNLSIEYVTKPEKPVINSDGTVSELSNREKNTVPDKWKNATVKENTSTNSDYEADITLDSGEIVTYAYDAMSFTEYAEELEQRKNKDKSVELQSDSLQKRSVSRTGTDIIDDIIDVLKLFDNEEIKDITKVYDLLEKDGFIKYLSGEEDLSEDIALMKTDFENGQIVYYLINPDASENTIQKYVLKKGNDAIQSTIFEALGIDGTAAGFVIDTTSNMAECYGTTIEVLLMKQSILLDMSLTESQREAKLKEVQKVADIACEKMIFTLLADSLGVLATMSSTTGVGIALGVAALVIDKVIIPMIERGDFDDFINGKISLDDLIIRWIIDPSGYVYEGVTSNRLSGATTTIYYKETLESNEVVKWNAKEYDQINPLKTDADGGYSWDVPEGYWQVKVELEGYETAYSEWLEVPPPQTNVNIKMIRKENPVVDSFEAYETFAILTFSQYMSPETIKSVQLKDGNGEDIGYSLSYSGDETDADGKVYAKKYILRYTNIVDSTDSIHLVVGDAVKSCSGNSAVNEEKITNILDDIEIMGNDYVKISIDDAYEYEFQIKGYDKEKLDIQVDHPSIVECTEISEISEEGKGVISLKPLAYGSATMIISLEGKSVVKKLDLSVGDETVSGKKDSTDISLPPVTSQPTPAPTKTPDQTAEPDRTPAPVPTKTPDQNITPTPVPTKDPTPSNTPDTSKDVQNKVPDSPGNGQITPDTTTDGPAKVTSLKLKAKKKSFTAKWKKVDGAIGYQLQYALSKKKLNKGKRKKTKKISMTIKKLKKKKTYYVRVRAYKVVGSRNVYGKWSAVKRVKIKK